MDPGRTASLLGIPSDIRAKIFRHAGLRRQCIIHLDGEKWRILTLSVSRYPSFGICRGNEELTYKKWQCFDGCTHHPLPMGLLASCSQMKDEAEKILYNENMFAVRCCSLKTPSMVEKIDALGKMRQLAVFFDDIVPTAHFPRCQAESNRQRTWEKLCTLFAQRLRPGFTNLHLEFPGAIPQEFERLIIEPLLSAGLPRLRNFRLDGLTMKHYLEGEIDEVDTILTSVRSAAGSLTHNEDMNFEVPIAQLPVEIQEIILSHTGLVQERNEAAPWPYNNAFITINPWSPTGNIFTFPCSECQEPLYSTHCSCAAIEAFVEFSGRYSGSGWMVSEVARHVFFSRNHFSVWGGVDHCIRTLLWLYPRDFKLVRNLSLKIVLRVEDQCRFSALIRMLQGAQSHPCLSIKIDLRYIGRLSDQNAELEMTSVACMVEKIVKDSLLKSVTVTRQVCRRKFYPPEMDVVFTR